jgi:hypothetical protein
MYYNSLGNILERLRAAYRVILAAVRLNGFSTVNCAGYIRCAFKRAVVGFENSVRLNAKNFVF